MTSLLQEAFSKASRLPPEEQDALARSLLKELDSESRWARSLAKSQGALANLAGEALRERRAGKTQEFNPDPP
jgi:hypothetical protein